MALVLAYGNPLRGDDAVGWRVAEALRGDPSVEIVCAQQLVPEVVMSMGDHRGVLFLDAAVGKDAGKVSVQRVCADAGGTDLGHVMTPGTCLALAEMFHGRAPMGILVTVVGSEFGFSESLSSPVAEAVPEATRRAREALRDLAAAERLLTKPRAI